MAEQYAQTANTDDYQAAVARGDLEEARSLVKARRTSQRKKSVSQDKEGLDLAREQSKQRKFYEPRTDRDYKKEYRPVVVKDRGQIIQVKKYRVYRESGKRDVKEYRSDYYDKKTGELIKFSVTSRNAKGEYQGRRYVNVKKGIEYRKSAPTKNAGVRTGAAGKNPKTGEGQGQNLNSGFSEVRASVPGTVTREPSRTPRPRFGAERPGTRIVYTARKGKSTVQFSDEDQIRGLQAAGWTVQTVTAMPRRRTRETAAQRRLRETQTPLLSTQIREVTGRRSGAIVERSREPINYNLQREQTTVTNLRPAEAALLMGTSRGVYSRGRKGVSVATGVVVSNNIISQGTTGSSLPRAAGGRLRRFANAPLKMVTNQPTVRGGIQAMVNVGRGFQQEGGELARGERPLDINLLRDSGRIRIGRNTPRTAKVIGTSVKTVGEIFEYLGQTAIENPSELALLYGGGYLVGATAKGATTYLGYKALSATTASSRALWGGSKISLQAAGGLAGAYYVWREGKNILEADKPGARATKTLLQVRGFVSGTRAATRYMTPTSATITGRYTDTLLTSEGGTVGTRGTLSFRKLGTQFKIPFQTQTAVTPTGGTTTTTFGQGFNQLTTTKSFTSQSFLNEGLTRPIQGTQFNVFRRGGAESVQRVGDFFYGQTAGGGSGGRVFFGDFSTTPKGRFSKFSISTQARPKITTPTRGLFVAGTGSNLQPSLLGLDTFTNPFAGGTATSVNPAQAFNINFLSGGVAGLPSLSPPQSPNVGLFGFIGGQSGVTSRNINRAGASELLPLRSQTISRTGFESLGETTPDFGATSQPLADFSGLFDIGSTTRTTTRPVTQPITQPVTGITSITPPPIPIGGGFPIPPIGIPPSRGGKRGRTRSRGFSYAPSLLGILTGRKRRGRSKTTFGIGIRGV